MPILVTQPAAPTLTQAVVNEVMAQAKEHCAPTTWDKFAKSLRANLFPFKV